MSKTKQLLILAIIAAVAATWSVIATNPLGAFYVHANQGGQSGVQKWEYCAITSASYSGGNFGARGTAVIRYFQVGGVREEPIEFVPDIGQNIGQRNEVRTYENGALNKAIAKLGDEGWELVSKEPDTDKNRNNIFYFKRPKQ